MIITAVTMVSSSCCAQIPIVFIAYANEAEERAWPCTFLSTLGCVVWPTFCYLVWPAYRAGGGARRGGGGGGSGGVSTSLRGSQLQGRGAAPKQSKLQSPSLTAISNAFGRSSAASGGGAMVRGSDRRGRTLEAVLASPVGVRALVLFLLREVRGSLLTLLISGPAQLRRARESDQR
jgi:hypothetical protein